MEKLGLIGREAASSNLKTEAATDSLVYSPKFLDQAKNILSNQIRLDTSLIEHEAVSEFAIGMESVKNIASLNPAGASGFIDEQAGKLEQAIIARYGDSLGEGFQAKKKQIVVTHKLAVIASAGKHVEQVSFEKAKSVLSSLSKNSNIIPSDELTGSLDEIHDKLALAYDPETAELLTHNAYEMAKLNRNVADGKEGYVSMEQPPVISFSGEKTQLNTSLTTNLLKAQSQNPMLARAYLRIHGLNSGQATELAKSIAEVYPDSPEIGAINTANTLREQALQLNPLEYGANQLYYTLDASPTDIFTGETDHRFHAALEARDLFGTTNFFTEQERGILKNAPEQVKIISFLKAEAKLRSYNSTLKPQDRIDSGFLDNELKNIDPDVYSWTTVLHSFPEFGRTDLGMVKETAANLGKEGRGKLSVPNEVLQVPGIGGFIEKLRAAHFLNTGDLLGAQQFLETKNSFAYTKNYEFGGSFEDAARLATGRNVRLKNIGVNSYRAYTQDGKPLLINGNTVNFTADFLSDTLKKNK